MKLNDAKVLGDNYLKEFKLDNWKIGFQNKNYILATCCHAPSQVIKLSKWYVKSNSSNDVSSTLLHEIAHALVGSGLGHGRIWSEKAKEIGVINPSYSKDTSTFNRPELKYTGKCNCLTKFKRIRKRKSNGFCSNCFAPIVWTYTKSNKVINFNHVQKILLKKRLNHGLE